MSSVNLVIIVEAIRTLLSPTTDKSFDLASILAVAAALGAQSVLSTCTETDYLFNPSGVKIMLFLYCHTLRSKSSQVHVLWEDHRNDIFINGFGMLLFSMDPILF